MVAIMLQAISPSALAITNNPGWELYNEDVKGILGKSHLLYSRKDIDKETSRVAQEVTEKLADKNPIVLSTLIGGMMFSTTLTEKLNFPLEMDYINISRYDASSQNAQNSKLLATPKKSLKNRHVLVIDNVLDGGVTLAKVTEYCKDQGASSVHTTVLTQKQRARDEGGLESADFIAFNVGNEFLIGFGLDYNGYLRNLPEIYAVKTA